MPLEIERLYTWDEDAVRRILSQAAQIVEDEGFSEDLRVTAFERAVTLLSHHIPMPKESSLTIPGGVLHG